MVGKAERQALKKAALLALEESRSVLTGEVLRMRSEWSPRELVRQSLERHRLAIMVGAALAGLAATRFFLRFSGGRRPRPALRGRLTGLAATALWSLFHEPALEFAKTRLASLLEKLHQSPSTEKPE